MSNKEHNMHKRALMIAFHFPPQAASSGIQRTLSFSRNLGKHGWEPLILSAHPRAYAEQNPSQLASVPASLIVKRAFALDTKTHMGYKGRYPDSLALPDRWVSWWFAAVPCGLGLIRRHKPQVIWSTFPIGTAHLIGLSLHRLTGLPWVADFRDPMLQPSYPTHKLQRKIFAWIERQTIQRCSRAVFTTHSAMQVYRDRYPELPQKKFVVIENGYDEDGFRSETAPVPAAPVPTARPQRLTLLHSGVLYQNGRDPSAFLHALAQLRDASRIDSGKVRVILRAPGSMEGTRKLVTRYGVEDMVEVAPPVPYNEALKEMLAADGLMIFQGTPFNNQIPAKIYEYFRARKPILGLVDTTGETARVLRAGGFHDLAQMDDSADIMRVLDSFVTRIHSGQAHIASEALVAASSRAHRASELAAMFDSVVGT